jgi:sirohydrochlorin cobaltochelatase
MDPALLVAGHGSRHPVGVAEFRALVDLVRALAPELRVGGGFIELAAPSVPAAASQLVTAGAREIVVVPLMLQAAGHTKEDIPTLIARARLAHPGVRFRYARDLGISAPVLAMLAERVDAAAAPEERPHTAVLLVGRGSSDPDANGDAFKVGRLLHEARRFQTVEVCFIGITGPRLPEGLERCRRLGARRIVALPYFLFTGILEERIHDQCAAFARAHPEVEVRVARYLGPDERIARLVLDRYREALQGEARMNCDTCIHRVPLPGFERRARALAPRLPEQRRDGRLRAAGHDAAHHAAPWA